MGFLEWYHYYNVEVASGLTKDWWFMGSPVPNLLVTFAYLYFILGCGPRYMKDKRAYEFKTFIKVYNAFQIVCNALLVYHIIVSGWYKDFFFSCITYDSYPNEYQMACLMWYTCWIKLIDYIETFMYVLRKKDRQISFLHIYHHISTFWIVWTYTKYWPDGTALTIIVVNCFVHVIMYTYYLLSSFGSTMQPYLQPIKPLITIIQMAQFILLIAYASQGLMPFCSDKLYQSCIIIVNLGINFILFYNFYKQNYKSKGSKKK